MTPATLAPVPQHLEALARANATRLARVAMKRRVTAGTMTAAEVILTGPQEAATMTVAELLASQRRWGDKRVRMALGHIGASEALTVGALTERQRRMLAAML